MSYTPEQIAEACAAADSFCATPAKNTLSVRKLRVLAEIVREQVARITALEADVEQLRAQRIALADTWARESNCDRRSMVLMHLTPDEQRAAYQRYDEEQP